MKDLNKILFLDLETTGLDPQVHNILSIGCAVWSPLRELDSDNTFEVFLKSNANFWVIDPKALEYNKYNLAEHEKKSVDFKKGLESFLKFLDARVDFPIVCAGINVNFDIAFLDGFVKHPEGSLFSHRTVDLSSILISLHHAGKLCIPSEYKSPSKWAFEFYGISPHHDGPKSPLKDVLASIKLYGRLLEILK